MVSRRSDSSGLGGLAAVVAAAALLAVGLAGGPLYVSSAASEALQVAMSNTCAVDVGLDLAVPSLGPNAGTDASELTRWLQDGADGIANSAEPLVTQVAVANFIVRDGDGFERPAYLLWRTEQLDHLDADVAVIGDGRILAPDQARARAGVTAGSVIEVETRNGAESFEVAGAFRDIPFLPEPSYWCGWRALLRPNAFGDPGPLVMIADLSAIARFPADEVFMRWELRPGSNQLTVTKALLLAKEYGRIRTAFNQHIEELIARMTDTERADARAHLPDQIDPRLDLLIDQAQQVGTVVDRTMAPVRLAGVAAGTLLLVGAAVLVARQRQRELRLLLLRGVSPVAIAARVARSQALPIAFGTAIGAALALAAVVTLGPTPELERGPIVSAAVSALGGGLVAIALVGGVTAAVIARTVDRGARRRRRKLPIELLIVGLAVLSYERLDRVGGVRLVGDQASGGDLMAQAFPLLALGAPLAVLWRPLVRLARRSRRWGGGLPVPVVSGLRRVGAEPGTSVMIAMASALSIGAFLISTAMTGSARQLLADKSAVYLGSDEVVKVTEYGDLPAGLTGTVVGRLDVRGNDGLAVEVIGIDPASFANAVRWRSDASDRSLAELLSVIDDPAPGDRLPAIVIGALDTTSDGLFRTPNRRELIVDPVATARWFPGKHAGTALVIVNRDALLTTGLDVAEQVWLRDPPVDAAALLEQAGFNVGVIQRSADVFDVISFRAVRWSYSALTAFGVVIAAAVVLAQLLVLDARRRTRQANGVLSRPMGLRTTGLATAVFTELAIPMIGGLLIGIGVAVGVLHLAVSRLDTLRQLQPPARVVIDLGAMATASSVGLVVLATLTVVGVVGIRRARPMEVMRGG